MRCSWMRWLAQMALLASVAFGHDAFGKDGAPKTRVHVVYPGQRLGSIAKRYNVSVEALCRVNNIRSASRISPGQKLIIPSRDDNTALASAPPDTADSTQPSPLSAIALPPSSAKNPEPPSDAPKSSAPSPKGLRAALGLSNRALPRVHVVQAGQRLGSIAKRYHLAIDALCQANGISRKSTLRVGQELVLPGTTGTLPQHQGAPTPVGTDKPSSLTSKPKLSKSVAEAAPTALAPSWRAYTKKPWRPGYIDVQGYKERWKGYVIGPKGDVLPQAKQHVSRVLSARRDLGIDKRLIVLIAKASDRFGGRPLRIVSGYRERSYARASRHRLGRAVDFSIPGVPNVALRDYLRTLKNVGVGYYPNSSFVHLDVREGAAYWVDYSRPGQAPIYRVRQSSPTGTGASAALGTPALPAAEKSMVDESEEDHDGTSESGGSDSKVSDSKASDSKASDSKASNSKASDAKVDDAATPREPRSPSADPPTSGPRRAPSKPAPSAGRRGANDTAPSEEAPDH